MKVYLLIINWSCEYEHGETIEVYSNLKDAESAMIKEIDELEKDGCLGDVLDSLVSMTNYADDDMIDKSDPDFKEFVDAVELARVIASGLAKLLDEN